MACFSFFILRALGELVLHRPSSGSFVSYAREFLGEKAAYVAGWMYFINWAMTGIVDITAVALYMHYWGAFGGVPQWVFALACTYHRWHHEYDRCEMVCGDGVLVCAY
ncbi:L-asparagine permease [Escherichia coli]|nr:L-asparagine permease [Escherichia coli]